VSAKIWSDQKARRVHNQRRYELKRKFGITWDDYERMKQAQGHSCAICKTTSPGGRGDWHVDHDHNTGRVRALLCWACNVGLGSFKDNINNLAQAISYLTKHKGMN
jgi:hypothetical protein